LYRCRHDSRHRGAADGGHLLDHRPEGVGAAGDQPDDHAAVLGGGHGGLGPLGRLVGVTVSSVCGYASRTASWTATATSGVDEDEDRLGECRGRAVRVIC
jgi:hypothetical protein